MLTSGSDLDCFVRLPATKLECFRVMLGDKLNQVKTKMMESLYPNASIK